MVFTLVLFRVKDELRFYIGFAYGPQTKSYCVTKVLLRVKQKQWFYIGVAWGPKKKRWFYIGFA